MFFILGGKGLDWMRRERDRKCEILDCMKKKNKKNEGIYAVIEIECYSKTVDYLKNNKYNK